MGGHEDPETLEAFLEGTAEILTREERRERIMQEAAERVKRERAERGAADGLLPCPDVSGMRDEDVEYTVDRCVEGLVDEVLVDTEVGDLDAVEEDLYPSARPEYAPKRNPLVAREDLSGVVFATAGGRDEVRKALEASRLASAEADERGGQDGDDDEEEEEDDPYAWLDQQETAEQKARRLREEEEDRHYAEAVMAHGNLSVAPERDTLSAQVRPGRRSRRDGELGNIENLSSEDLQALRTQLLGGGGGKNAPRALDATLKSRTAADGSAGLSGGGGGQNDALHGARGRVTHARLSALEDALL